MKHTDMDVAQSPLKLNGKTPMVRLAPNWRRSRCVTSSGQTRRRPIRGSRRTDRRSRWSRGGARRSAPGPVRTIIEPTSGNTGVGLAIVAAQRGYNCIFVMSDKMAPEKTTCARLRAEVVVCPTAVAPEHPDSYYSTAERLTKETPNSFRPDQYSNPHNPRAHYETTGRRSGPRPRAA